jgi:NAD(P)-dependent dehydrogenase (short-subunit alcohol dehydrogenase family)
MPYQSAKAGLVTMALYLAFELKDQNIAVNVLLPGHTRSTGSDEQEAERARMRSRLGQAPAATRRLTPEHVVPLALHLAEQDASGVTGQVLKATEWNQAHGAESFVFDGDAAVSGTGSTPTR